MHETYSLIKIFSNDLQIGQAEKFEFSTKGYSNIAGIMVSGRAETSLIFDKESRLVIHSMELNSNKSVKPNKRVHEYKHEIKNELIKGSVVKKETVGKVSVYLKIK